MVDAHPNHASQHHTWLSVRNAYKSFWSGSTHVQALRGVDFDVPEGSFSAILGPSGCGKSTLLKIIAGIDRQDHGEVYLADQLLGSDDVFVPAERRDIGIVPQEGALFPHLSVARNVGFGLQGWSKHHFSRGARKARAERIHEMLDLVGLADYADRRPHELSGGQQQRVALARALAPAPKLILLDEPFSALDASLRTELRLEVRELLKQSDTTAILVTHDQEEALSLADQVAIMRSGKIVQAGSPHEIYTRPADPTTARFVGDAVLLPGTIGEYANQVANCELGDISLCSSCKLRGGPCMVMLRPEQVVLDVYGMPAIVRDTTFFGHDALVTLALGEAGTGSVVTIRLPQGPLPRPGDQVQVRVAGDAIAYADHHPLGVDASARTSLIAMP